jgi:hypothetical protein
MKTKSKINLKTMHPFQIFKDLNLKSLLSFCLILICYHSISQSSAELKNYEQQMKEDIDKIYEKQSYDDYLMAAHNMSEIAEELESEWIPYYHTTYAYLMSASSALDKSEADKHLDSAQEMIDKAKKVDPRNSEIIALQGMLYQSRIGINPKERVNKYLPLAVMEYDQARFIDKSNPRPYYLIGQILYTIPKAYGGNKENACRHFTQAKERFDIFEPQTELSPNWGKKANQQFLNKCQ